MSYDIARDGHLFAIDPYGELMRCTKGPGNEEKFEIIEVDTDVVRKRREKEGADFNLNSRSPEHYDRLTKKD